VPFCSIIGKKLYLGLMFIVIKNGMCEHKYILICIKFCNNFLVIILFCYFEVSENIYFYVTILIMLIPFNLYDMIS